ncbi:MAG TPA: cyclic 2,3-diphosphoglycerate synthase [Candidatus Thermoplasmatota archaeon]|nr:cyclic 2,3-diphosphoglycerate synthase [Candidatus Thermoplasmatota archaeon]
MPARAPARRKRQRRRVVILGAAGRDFHNFNVAFRDDAAYEVVAFTATQIPDIAGRRYPKELAGKLYPKGIPILAEQDLAGIIRREDVDLVVLAYSDLSYPYVMERSALVNAAGADFLLMGPKRTMLRSKRPVVAVTAVRTGSGKSQTSRKIFKLLRDAGHRVVSIRHPMPYGDLVQQRVQRFASYADLDKAKCTIEEREEYEPYIDLGGVVYAGVDYAEILARAEKEADIIIWDGGNNDFAFLQPDVYITVVDPLRPGHEIAYYPGEVNLRLADVVIINKIGTAQPDDVETVRANTWSRNPDATIIEAASPITVDDPTQVQGKRVLCVEDGPTITHGGMPYGAAIVAAERFGAADVVDAKPFAVGSLKAVYQKYPHIDKVLPAMGYGPKQVKELQQTINKADADVVLSGTPIDLRRVLKANKPIVRVRYELQEIGKPDLRDVLKKFL